MTEFVENGVSLIRESGDYFTARIFRCEDNGRDVHCLFILGTPIAECDTADECRRLLAAILLASEHKETP